MSNNITNRAHKAARRQVRLADHFVEREQHRGVGIVRATVAVGYAERVVPSKRGNGNFEATYEGLTVVFRFDADGGITLVTTYLPNVIAVRRWYAQRAIANGSTVEQVTAALGTRHNEALPLWTARDLGIAA